MNREECRPDDNRIPFQLPDHRNIKRNTAIYKIQHVNKTKTNQMFGRTTLPKTDLKGFFFPPECLIEGCRLPAQGISQGFLKISVSSCSCRGPHQGTTTALRNGQVCNRGLGKSNITTVSTLTVHENLNCKICWYPDCIPEPLEMGPWNQCFLNNTFSRCSSGLRINSRCGQRPSFFPCTWLSDQPQSRTHPLPPLLLA